MNMEQDGCTGFFDTWYTWKMEKINLGKICSEVHDTTCSSTQFFKGMWKNRVIGTSVIALAGALGCWVKFPKYMWKRL